jgi:Chorismate mutase
MPLIFSTFIPMDINEWRIRIDELNDELIALLNKRASYAVEIGKIKKEKGLPVFDKAREQSVLDVVAAKAAKAGGPLSPDSFKNIFRVIMEETCKVEE